MEYECDTVLCGYHRSALSWYELRLSGLLPVRTFDAGRDTAAITRCSLLRRQERIESSLTLPGTHHGRSSVLAWFLERMWLLPTR